MKKLVILFVMMVVLVGVVLNLHFIRTEEGLDIILKDGPAFRDTYADIRDFSIADLSTYSPRILNYVIVERKIPEMKTSMEDKARLSLESIKAGLEDRGEGAVSGGRAGDR